MVNKFSNEYIKEVLDTSVSKTEICKRLNAQVINGREADLIISYYINLIKYPELLNTQILHERKKIFQFEKYYQNPSKCKCCGKVFSYNERTKKFCNCSCAVTFNNKERTLSEETKNKISIGVKNSPKFKEAIKVSHNKTFKVCRDKTIKLKVCKICGKEFMPKVSSKNVISHATTCSLECHNELIKLVGKETYKKVKESGKFKGWKTRNITSYAEKFWENVLNNNNISYTREKKVDKYFLDFVIEVNGISIDLEIDGKQHEYNDRKESDIIRDEFLTSNGYKVYRIPWNAINSDSGKVQMKNKIEDFLKFYKSFK